MRRAEKVTFVCPYYSNLQYSTLSIPHSFSHSLLLLLHQCVCFSVFLLLFMYLSIYLSAWSSIYNNSVLILFSLFFNQSLNQTIILYIMCVYLFLLFTFVPPFCLCVIIYISSMHFVILYKLMLFL